MSKTKSYFGVVICAFIASLFVSGLYNNIVFAASASISTTGTVSIDVSAAGNSANLGSDTLTVNTTCSTGYTVSISSSIADTTLYKDGDNTSTSKITPSTGTVTSPASILGNNLGTWGYSTTATSVQDNFIGLTNTPTIIKQSSVASATTGDSIPVYYGVSIPTSLEPGTYTMAKDASNNPGTIVYQLTMPTECNPYIIKYNGNNNDAGTTMSVTNTVDEGQSTTLMPSNYKRAGYGFAGWNTKADGTGTDFGPMEDVTLSTSDTKGNALLGAADTNKEITLYAKWIQSQGNIQSWSGCSSLASGAVTALTDTRDNNVYAVAKLADGNCWMIENLRLGGTSPMALTPADTAVSTNFTLPASTDPTTTAWCNTADATCIDKSMLYSGNATNPVTDMTTTNADIYSYGNYYNWYGATAGSRTTDANVNNASASSSICPAGWRLPIGGNNDNSANSDFRKLAVAVIGYEPNASCDQANCSNYNGDGADPNNTASRKMRNYPNNFFSTGGEIHGAQFMYRSSGNYYNTSTGGGWLAHAYYFGITSYYVGPGTRGAAKYEGRNVRCVADKSASPGKIMYHDNGAESPTKMGEQDPGNVTSVDLWPSNFQRSGYGFAGWNTKADGTGTKYGPMETITLPSDFATNGLNLYAMWIPSAGNIQGWTGCSSLATGAVTALKDTRDNNVYAVAKLADGKCWMIENLRLGGSSAMNLTTANTVTAFTLPASTNTFTTSNYTTIEMSAKNTLEAPTNMTTPTNAEVYSYGNYYSWPAAIGSTTAYSTNNQSVNTSICPSGWHLPKGGDSNNATNGEFWKLGTAIMNGTTPNIPNNNYSYYDNNVANTAGKTATAAIRSYPNNFLYSGRLYGSSFNNRGFIGYYWSSTVYNSYRSYRLSFASSNVLPGTGNDNKFYGYSVRCVAGS